MRIQRVDEHLAMPWANGLGTSYEVASDRNADGEWTWRVAIAPVVLDGPFSVMPGVDRELVVIEGNGMVLEIDGESVECLPGRVIRFSGDSTVFARLVEGPVVDLGLMTVRGSVTGSLVVVANAGEIIESDVVLAVGDTELEDESGGHHELETMDALLGLERHRMVLLNGTAIAIQLKSL